MCSSKKPRLFKMRCIKSSDPTTRLSRAPLRPREMKMKFYTKLWSRCLRTPNHKGPRSMYFRPRLRNSSSTLESLPIVQIFDSLRSLCPLKRLRTMKVDQIMLWMSLASFMVVPRTKQATIFLVVIQIMKARIWILMKLSK